VLTRHAITRRADTDGVDSAVVERDYVLTHIVTQLHRATMEGTARLVFKGGTALRLVHLEDYRYSADLDFTILGGNLSAATTALAKTLEAAREHTGLPVLQFFEGDSHGIEYIGPLGANKPRLIKLDISDSEIVESIEQRTILPGLWPDLPDLVPFDVYSLEEIAAEKLRCVIQRVQCRDLYDIFRLVEDTHVSLVDVRPLFERKATAKGLDPATFAGRLEDRLPRYKDRWHNEMSDHLREPPRIDDVIRVVRRHLRGAGLVAR